MAGASHPVAGEPGSFRDPGSRVFYDGTEVFRALSQYGLADYEALASSGLLEDTRIVATEIVDRRPPALFTEDAAVVLRHERVPFISYPYEWTFSMLKDAALLQLDLMLAALDHDLSLKDATPYNVQYVGARAVFVDVGSFERLREEELWVGYRQFCMLYLFPLLLQSTKGLSFQPWLRGSIDGITPTQMRAVMSFRDRLRRGYLTNVFLQARFEGKDSGPRTGIKAQLKRPGLGKQLIFANVRKMRKLVSRLEWNPPAGVWTGYGHHNTYTDVDARKKDDFVRAVATSKSWPLVWDIGCNNGRHSRIAAERADQVIAIDSDQGTVELLYRELRDAGDQKIVPLTMNIADPSPGLGWRGLERKPLLERGRPDLVLALAVVHHLSIGANVPLREVIDWLASLGGAVVLEFPTPEDPMVQKLLAPKRKGLHSDYERGFLEQCLNEAFDIHETSVLESNTRVLYYATPKGR